MAEIGDKCHLVLVSNYTEVNDYLLADFAVVQKEFEGNNGGVSISTSLPVMLSYEEFMARCMPAASSDMSFLMAKGEKFWMQEGAVISVASGTVI